MFESLLHCLWLHPCCTHQAATVQAALRDKLLQDHSVLAAFLTGLRMYLEDPTKVINCHLQAYSHQKNQQT